MSPVHYSRVSTDSDNESSEKISVEFRNSPTRNRATIVGRRSENNNGKRRSPWTAECISRLMVLFVLFLVAIGFAIARFPIHKFHSHESNHKEMEHHHTVFHEAAVAAGQKVCSTVGVKILRKGGNAVDAAIATILCECVVEPEFTGIGGGLVMTIYNKAGDNFTVIDARETAPLQSNRTMFGTGSAVAKSLQGPLAIGVPGTLKGLSYAYKNYGGKVSWKELFEPAIALAKEFQVNGELAKKISIKHSVILGSESLCPLYCDKTRTDTKKAGDTVNNPTLAETLTKLSEHGAEIFYESPMADQMAAEIQRSGGIITAEDFKTYQVIERKPINVTLPNAHFKLFAPPLPFGGPVLAMIMSVMDSFNLTAQNYSVNPSLQWHRTVESFKHAFGARTHFGDPAFVANATQLVEQFISPAFINSVRSKINDKKTFKDPLYYGATPVSVKKQDTSTTHISVLAPNGDAVAVTSTIDWYFGSTFISPSTGVVFNNELADFNLPETSDAQKGIFANSIEPGKRPLSSMTPCMLYDEKSSNAVFIIGAAGGPHILTAVADSLLRLLYFGTGELSEAIEDKRLHHQLLPNILSYESGFDESIISDLRDLGHNVVVSSLPNLGDVNGIKNHISHVHAYSDERVSGSGADGW